MAANGTGITVAILAGGAGARMGGAEKGLQPWTDGRPLVAHVVERMQPQAEQLAIVNRRSQPDFRRWTAHLWADADIAGRSLYPGPLAGIETALNHCQTPFLLTVPCDAPCLPANLAYRLQDALRQQADTMIAVAATSVGEGATDWHPVCLMLRIPEHPELRASLQAGLRAAVDSPERSVRRWIKQYPYTVVLFDDPDAFCNINLPVPVCN